MSDAVKRVGLGESEGDWLVEVLAHVCPFGPSTDAASWSAGARKGTSDVTGVETVASDFV
jgi:hypothetical protein